MGGAEQDGIGRLGQEPHGVMCACGDGGVDRGLPRVTAGLLRKEVVLRAKGLAEAQAQGSERVEGRWVRVGSQ